MKGKNQMMEGKIRVLKIGIIYTGRQYFRLRLWFAFFLGVLLVGPLVQLTVNRIDIGLIGYYYDKEPETLLNLNFSWLSNNEQICSNQDGILWRVSTYPRILPILVTTGRNNTSEREVIRKTWGSLRNYRDWEIRLVFLLGQAETTEGTEEEELDRILQAEQYQFGDLVIGSFIDSYRNLSFKTMMGYKWILDYCRRSEFVMKIDDDSFLDIMQWIDWLSDDLDKFALDKNYIVPDLLCNLIPKAAPYRKRSSKYVVTKEEWPKPFYPDFCQGWAYSIRTEIIERIYNVSNSVKVFWLEDVFSTGILLEEASKKFGFQPKVRSVAKEMSHLFHIETKENLPLCENGVIDYDRKFKTVVQVVRGEFFERDMKCYWDKVLYDRSQTV